MTKAGQEQGKADQHRVRRRLLDAQRAAQQRQDHDDTGERGDGHQDAGCQREDRQQQDDLDQTARETAALSQIQRQALRRCRIGHEEDNARGK